jgi:hypothetical protein
MKMATGFTNAQQMIQTVMLVTVTDASSSGYQQGRTVTATNGTDTQTGTTDASGSVRLLLKGVGDYTVTADVPSGSGGTIAAQTVSVELGGVYSVALVLSFGWGKFGMSFNATTFKTDPTGCLAYTDDCAGYTPVSGPGSSLAKCSTIGDWEMKSDGTSDNPLLAECFYATFTSGGVLHEKLNPQNLTQKIATWNNTSKQWESASGSSSITSENTMFCIPKCYVGSTASKIVLSGSESDGTAFAHTIGGHTYDYLAIGVYEGYDDGTKLWSKSGVASSASITRPTFRSHAQAQTVQDGHAMVWNFHQWNLWRIMTIFAMKSFNGQSQIGQGGFTYNGSTGQGLCNAMGPFAGDTSTSPSTSKSVKAYIENPWGYKYEFIDDAVAHDGHIWVGQNAQPDDTYTSASKTDLGAYSFDNIAPNAISTTPISWGLGTAMGGSATTGLCDYQYINTSGDYLARVGGYSDNVSNGSAGPSCLRAGNALDYSAATYGARLAFVFDV